MFDKRCHLTRCISCHAVHPNPPPDRCPRCGADNRAWHAWVHAGRREHLKHFFLGSPWGWLALTSLLLPPISWAAFDVGPLVFETVILFVSLLLSLAGFFLIFVARDALWIYELARRVLPRFREGLLSLGGIGFLAFTAMVGILAVAWVLASLKGEALAFSGPVRPAVAIVMGLVFTGHTLAAGLYSAYAYGQWLSMTFPSPIFLDEARLLRLVERATKPRIQVKTSRDGTVMTRVVELSRTDQAGLNLKIRAEVATEEVLEGCFLKALQHWRVVSDKWGHVKQFGQEGPLEYIPDSDRAHTPPEPEELGASLEGELILPNKRASPTLEEAIVIAFTSEHRWKLGDDSP